MSKKFKTEGIILTRTNFGEADRILTFLTPDHGKIKAIAKSVRKSQSRLAGGLELFSVSHITVVVGRGEINTLISTRLKKHYSRIVKNLERTGQAYEILALINKNTEEAADGGYFELLESSLLALDDPDLEVELIKLWFGIQLLKLSGHAPNLRQDVNGETLSVSGSYDFAHERVYFIPKLAKSGAYSANHIKFLRIGFSVASPKSLQRVNGAGKLAKATQPLVETMLKTYLRT